MAEDIKDKIEESLVGRMSQDSREYLTSLINSIRDPIFVKDRQHRLVLVNDAECRLAGHSREDIIGKTDYDFFPKEQVDVFWRQDDIVFESGQENINEEEITDASGSTRTIVTKKTLYIDREGNKFIVGIIRDITDLKEIEKKLKETQLRHEAVLDNIPDIAWLKDKESRFIAVNEAFGKACGWKPADMVGKNDFDIWPRDLAERYRADDKEVMESGKRKRVEEPLADKEGKVLLIETIKTPIYNDKGEIAGTTGIARDITERKHMEEMLREARAELEIRVKVRTAELTRVNEELHREVNERTKIENALKDSELIKTSLLNAVPNAILLLNQRTIIYANEATEAVFGWRAEEIIGQKTRVLYRSDEDYEKIGSLFYPRFQYERAHSEEFICRHKDGKDITCLVSAAVIGDGSAGQNIVAVYEDITGRKLMEECIQKINACFLNFVADPSENIKRLTALAGELLKADCAIYNCLEGQMLCARGQWNTPFDFKTVDGAKGHICHDVISMENDFPVVIRNLHESDYAQSDPNVLKYDLKTYIGQAVKMAGFTRGSLCVLYKKDFVSSESDLKILNILASAVGVEEKRKQVEEAFRKGERFLSSVFSSIQDGISILDTQLNIVRVNPTMEKWYSHAMPLIGKKCYDAYHIRGVPCESCPTQHTLRTRQTAYEAVPKRGPGGKITGWLDLYSFPLINLETEELEGVIEYVRDITVQKQAEEAREALNLELVKSNERLKKISLMDSHTGLYNHRFLEEFIEAEFQRASRYAHSLSVIMLDIDYFKSINDVYGHHFGDLVLKQFAKLLKKVVRRYDLVFRLGGEEFIIVSPGIDRSQALLLAQRLLDTINLYNFGNKQHNVKLKVSLAALSYPEDKTNKGIDLINLADLILNKAKESGGNRVYSSADIKKNKKHGLVGKAGKKINVKFLEEKIDKLTKKANQSLVEAIFAFAKTIEVKDHYTGEHAEHTVRYATSIASVLGLTKEEIELVRQAATLHDLGKVGISERILTKPGKLTRKEFEEIKKHPQIGADIIRPIQFLHNLIPLIFYHHEKWNGKGYPTGIKGEEIPIGARIIAIADAYQALTSDRPYRKSFSKAEAKEIIKKGSGTQFDPRIVSAFLKILEAEK